MSNRKCILYVCYVYAKRTDLLIITPMVYWNAKHDCMATHFTMLQAEFVPQHHNSVWTCIIDKSTARADQCCWCIFMRASSFFGELIRSFRTVVKISKGESHRCDFIRLSSRATTINFFRFWFWIWWIQGLLQYFDSNHGVVATFLLFFSR